MIADKQPNGVRYRPDYPRMVKYIAMFAVIQSFLILWIIKFFGSYYGTATAPSISNFAIWWTLIAAILYLIGSAMERHAPQPIIWLLSPCLIAAGTWFLHSRITADPVTFSGLVLLGGIIAPPLLWSIIPVSKLSLAEQYATYQRGVVADKRGGPGNPAIAKIDANSDYT